MESNGGGSTLQENPPRNPDIGTESASRGSERQPAEAYIPALEALDAAVFALDPPVSESQYRNCLTQVATDHDIPKDDLERYFVIFLSLSQPETDSDRRIRNSLLKHIDNSARAESSRV